MDRNNNVESGIQEDMCKSIDPKAIEEMKCEVAIALCMLEKEFPSSFFDIMSHLVMHLVKEVEICGPVHTRWMNHI